MSGQQDQWEQLDRWDLQDHRDAVTLDLSRLLNRVLPDDEIVDHGNGAEHSPAPIRYRETDAAVERDRAARATPATPVAAHLPVPQAPHPPVAPELARGAGRHSEPVTRQMTRSESGARETGGNDGGPATPPRPPGTRAGPAQRAEEAIQRLAGTAEDNAAAAASTDGEANLPPATPAIATTPIAPMTPDASTTPDLPAPLDPTTTPDPTATPDETGAEQRQQAEPVPAEHERRAERPAHAEVAGSAAVLRHRLESLPVGHPSSPYHDDGTRKPPPPRLKHLELAPPGRERLADQARPISARMSRSGGVVPEATTTDAPTTRDPLESLRSADLTPVGAPSTAPDRGTPPRWDAPRAAREATIAPAWDDLSARPESGEPALVRHAPATSADATSADATSAGYRPGQPPEPADPPPAEHARLSDVLRAERSPAEPADAMPAGYNPRRRAESADPPPVLHAGLPSATQAVPAPAPRAERTPPAPQADLQLPSNAERMPPRPPGQVPSWHDPRMPPRSADLPALPPAEFASSEPAGQVRAWDDQRGVPEQPELAPAGDRARAAETTLPGRHHGGIRPVSTVSYPSWATTPDLFGQSGASRPREGQSPASQPVPTATPVGDGNELAVRPNGPRAEPDGSWTWGSARLNPDQVRIADDMHGRLHAAEGRTAHDGYGNGGLTAKLRRIEAGLEHGRLAPDRGQRALIDPDIFKAELAGLIRRHPGVPAEELARHITGALSYTFVFDPAHYSAGIWLVHDVLRAQGFWLEARRNGWAGTGPKGVVSSWLDPSFDVAFQVQFHTAASFAAQQLARTSANAIRDPRTPPAEAARLKSDLASTWATVASPVGTTEIGDYRRATR